MLPGRFGGALAVIYLIPYESTAAAHSSYWQIVPQLAPSGTCSASYG